MMEAGAQLVATRFRAIIDCFQCLCLALVTQIRASVVHLVLAARTTSLVRCATSVSLLSRLLLLAILDGHRVA